MREKGQEKTDRQRHTNHRWSVGQLLTSNKPRSARASKLGIILSAMQMVVALHGVDGYQLQLQANFLLLCSPAPAAAFV